MSVHRDPPRLVAGANIFRIALLVAAAASSRSNCFVAHPNNSLSQTRKIAPNHATVITPLLRTRQGIRRKLVR
jgi:hypothetical protein